MTEPTAGGTECACCGLTVDEGQVVRLVHRPDIALCRDCVAALPSRRNGLLRAVPVLSTTNLAASMRFWQAAGFDVHQYGGDFASAYRDGVELHLVDVSESSRNRGAAYLHVRGVDSVHDAWAAAGLPASDVRGEPWDMREFHIVDPGGKLIRVGQNI